MPVDPKLFNAPATRGDIAGVTIDCVIGLRAISEALVNLKAGKDIAKNIAKIEETRTSLNKAFDRLSGWTD